MKSSTVKKTTRKTAQKKGDTSTKKKKDTTAKKIAQKKGTAKKTAQKKGTSEEKKGTTPKKKTRSLKKTKKSPSSFFEKRTSTKAKTNEESVLKEKDALVVLNEDKEGGINDCLEDFCLQCEKNDMTLKNKDANEAKSQTGVKVLSMYRRDQIISYLSTLEEYRNAPENSEERSLLYQAKKEASLNAKSGWEDRFRLFSPSEGSCELQRPSHTFLNRCSQMNKKRKDDGEKKLTSKQKRDLMEETDWVPVHCIDDRETLLGMNEIHWNDDNPAAHMKHNVFFKLVQKKYSSNITSQLCKEFISHCKVCQLVTERWKSRDSKGLAKNILVIITIITVPNSDLFQLSHLMVVLYTANNYIDLIPLKNLKFDDICGHLYGSFVKNSFPTHLRYMFTHSSYKFKSDRKVVLSAESVEQTIVSTLNNWNANIEICDGKRDRNMLMKMCCDFLNEVLSSKEVTVQKDFITIILMKMLHTINDKEVFGVHRKNTFLLSNTSPHLLFLKEVFNEVADDEAFTSVSIE